MLPVYAGVLELVDEVDSKSIASDGVRVRVPPPAPTCIDKKDAGKNPALLCGIFAHKSGKTEIIQNNNQAFTKSGSVK